MRGEAAADGYPGARAAPNSRADRSNCPSRAEMAEGGHCLVRPKRERLLGAEPELGLERRASFAQVAGKQVRWASDRLSPA